MPSTARWAGRASALGALATVGAVALSGVAVADNLVDDVNVGAGGHVHPLRRATAIGYKINGTGGAEEAGDLAAGATRPAAALTRSAGP